jgi:hypothetical protein
MEGRNQSIERRRVRSYFAAFVSLAGGFGIFRNSCRISIDVFDKNSRSFNGL